MEKMETDETLKGILTAIEALANGQQALATNLAAGFREVNERLDRIERTLNATFEQVGKPAEDVTLLKSDVGNLKTDVSELKTDVAELKTDVADLKTLNERLDAQRNLIGKAEEAIELLKMKAQN